MRGAVRLASFDHFGKAFEASLERSRKDRPEQRKISPTEETMPWRHYSRSLLMTRLAASETI
jgi:hypothetical protein